MQDLLNPSDSPSWGGYTRPPGPTWNPPLAPGRGRLISRVVSRVGGETYFPAPVCSELMSGPTLQALSQVGGKREQMGV